MSELFSCYASAAFGLEGVVASELRRLNMENVVSENGGVRFFASAEDIMICNLKLHCCEKVFVIAGEGTCLSFEDLFQLVYSLPWQNWAEGREAFNISAKCARSKLMSPRDCQSITKKAILEKIRHSKHQNTFPEDGDALPVQISVHSDHVKILINTSGEALSKRGYRTWNGEAPIRESLASALVQLSPWKMDRPLYDPCCGTGTILIEAALLALHRAPGLHRSFAMEKMRLFHGTSFDEIRRRVSSESNVIQIPEISGSDIDPEAVDLANRHIRQASVTNEVKIKTGRLQEVQLAASSGVFICNPPYGERLSDQKSCRLLYRDLHSLKDRHPSWSMCVISSDPAFERFFGRRADRKRRLYNGRLECTYYIYF